jgi:hypothetical protein
MTPPAPRGAGPSSREERDRRWQGAFAGGTGGQRGWGWCVGAAQHGAPARSCSSHWAVHTPSNLGARGDPPAAWGMRCWCFRRCTHKGTTMSTDTPRRATRMTAGARRCSPEPRSTIRPWLRREWRRKSGRKLGRPHLKPEFRCSSTLPTPHLGNLGPRRCTPHPSPCWSCWPGPGTARSSRALLHNAHPSAGLRCSGRRVLSQQRHLAPRDLLRIGWNRTAYIPPHLPTRPRPSTPAQSRTHREPRSVIEH